MRAAAAKLAAERGEALVEALLLLAGALLPLLALIALAARLELARLRVDQAALDAARAASRQASQAAAESAAAQTLARAQRDGVGRLSLQLDGRLVPGDTLTATVTSHVQLLPGLDLLGRLGAVTVHAQARVPVDRYRSLP